MSEGTLSVLVVLATMYWACRIVRLRIAEAWATRSSRRVVTMSEDIAASRLTNRPR